MPINTKPLNNEVESGKDNKKDKKVLVPARSEVFLKQFRKILEYRIQDKIQ